MARSRRERQAARPREGEWIHDVWRPSISVSIEVRMSAVELTRNRPPFDKAGLARFVAVAMLAGASGFIFAIILT